jgi:hypothetical protein
MRTSKILMKQWRALMQLIDNFFFFSKFNQIQHIIFFEKFLFRVVTYELV